MSADDAVDGSSTRRASAMDVGAVKAPTIRRSYLYNGHDNRSRYREVSLSGPRRRRGGYRRDPADWYCLVRGQLMRGGFPFFGFVVLS
jgi:hypothetical protein